MVATDFTHVRGIFPHVSVPGLRAPRCPRCHTMKSRLIARRPFDGIGGWSRTNRYVKKRLGCTRCLISWDTLNYARFWLVLPG